MASGGKRDGAGRKKGVPNRVNAEKRAEIAKTGETPLDYALRVMRDPGVDHERRDKLAIAAMAFVHARLTSLQPPVEGSGSITITWKNGA